MNQKVLTSYNFLQVNPLVMLIKIMTIKLQEVKYMIIYMTMLKIMHVD